MKQSTPTRRRFLAGSAAAGVVGLAGCGALGGGNGNGSGNGGNGNGGDQTTVETGEQPLSAPVLGDPEASVTVMAFEDHRCPHCQTYSLEYFPEIRSEYVEPGDVRYEFHDLPVVNDESWRSASAARAVQDTVGNDAFWSYSKLLFENQNSLGPDTYASLAEEVDADPETVRTAAVEEAYRPTVEADRQRGIDMGVQSTPTIVVDGQLLDSYEVEAVSSAIDSAL
jgi:protein-disulfide isomerase